jgi:hypothetical protein
MEDKQKDQVLIFKAIRNNVEVRIMVKASTTQEGHNIVAEFLKEKESTFEFGGRFIDENIKNDVTSIH